MDSIFIVGGGPSLSGVDFNLFNGRDTIAINASICDVPTPKYFITMDNTFFNKINISILINSHAKKIFVANFASNQLKLINNKIIDIKRNVEYKTELCSQIIISNRLSGFGTTLKDFSNGNNSGFCALQYALLLGYKNIYLCGIDLKTEPQAHYHNKYAKSPKITQQINSFSDNFMDSIRNYKELFPNSTIFNCSRISILNNLLEYKDLNKL